MGLVGRYVRLVYDYEAVLGLNEAGWTGAGLMAGTGGSSGW